MQFLSGILLNYAQTELVPLTTTFQKEIVALVFFAFVYLCLVQNMNDVIEI